MLKITRLKTDLHTPAMHSDPPFTNESFDYNPKW